MPEQGDLSLLEDPVAQELLNSTHLARLAYVWPDGTSSSRARRMHPR
jgi:hypothetical protein